jgi:hypothetical protein
MRAGLSFSRSSISLLLRQPLSIKKSYAGAIHYLTAALWMAFFKLAFKRDEDTYS